MHWKPAPATPDFDSFLRDLSLSLSLSLSPDLSPSSSSSSLSLSLSFSVSLPLYTSPSTPPPLPSLLPIRLSPHSCVLSAQDALAHPLSCITPTPLSGLSSNVFSSGNSSPKLCKVALILCPSHSVLPLSHLPVAPARLKAPGEREACLSSWLLYSQHLAQCLAHSRCLIIISYMTKQILPGARQFL